MKQGEKFEISFEMTDIVYEGFMKIFNDKNPLHTDEKYAKNKGFKSKVMHGNILGGFLSYFIGECLPDKNVIIYSQEIKYRKPVYIHNILKLFAETGEVFESVKTIEIKFYFENEENIKVASGKIQIGYI